MKNFILFLVASLLSVFCLTSCLEGSNVYESDTYGVLVYGAKNYSPVLSTSVGYLSSPNLDALYMRGDLEMGGCYYLYYRHDSDLPENAPNVVEANGYSTISLIEYYEVPKFHMNQYLLTDTSSVLPNEIPILETLGIQALVEKNLFLIQAANQPSEVDLEWDMSYDNTTMMPVTVGDYRYYDIFIRATKKNSSDKSSVAMQYLNAYNIGDYLEHVANTEKTLLGGNYYEMSSKFTIRFNYASDIRGDTAIVWKNVVWEQYVADYLPRE